MWRSIGVLVVALAGCAGAPMRAVTASASTTSPSAAPREPLAWADFSAETFARAKAERKFVVMDGSAEWCHWCHVMEATTYHDAGVRRILDEHFIAVKVDVDSRPDLEERYGDWGWPATIIFSPDAEELGKYRGYIAPDDFRAILAEVVTTGAAARAAEPPRATKQPALLGEAHLRWVQDAVELELDDYWDEDQGGWGRTQKAPLGWNNAWMLLRAERGDARAKEKVLFALDQQAALIDPVWGGIYQYSAARDWSRPHFEKLMTFQAPALENYAVAYRMTREPRHLERARRMLGYLDRFMKSPDGAFYASQDADLNAHDRTKAFMDGHAYHALGEAARLARGIPRIDTHEYGKENGLAIAAYCTMYEVTKDAAVLASAEKAARRVLATHRAPGARGGISHDVLDPAAPPKVLFLADNAAFGLALLRLHAVTGDARYVEEARAIAYFMLRELADDASGGLFASTIDPDAVGVFARRRVPFEDNVVALRLFARLGLKDAIDRVLAAITVPAEIKARGRMLGDYLLALEETKGVR